MKTKKTSKGVSRPKKLEKKQKNAKKRRVEEFNLTQLEGNRRGG